MPDFSHFSVCSARFAQSMVCAAWVWGAVGCATVHIEAKDGEVRTVRHLGMLQVELANPEQAIAASLWGVGLISAPLGWSLGYTQQRWVLMGKECRAVVWLAPGGIDEQMRNDLVRAAGVCLIEADEHATRPAKSTGGNP